MRREVGVLPDVRHSQEQRLEPLPGRPQQRIAQQRPMLRFRRPTVLNGALLQRTHHRVIDIPDDQLSHIKLISL
jgi:hypothetical protein